MREAGRALDYLSATYDPLGLSVYFKAIRDALRAVEDEGKQETDERAAFEKWASVEPCDFERDKDTGLYVNPYVRIMWGAWQAAIRARAGVGK